VLVHRITSEYLASNTYILEFAGYDNVILIDCGEIEARSILKWLERNKKIPSHVFLTHSDSDHIAGINWLHKFYDFEIRSTSYCSSAIKSSKSNFSKYIPRFEGGFSIDIKAIEVYDGETLDIYDKSFHFIHTPGHTHGCMCIKVNDLLFSGDTIIKGIKTRINHRSGGSMNDLNKSLEKLKSICNENCIVYPGHGEPINAFFTN
jgi:hydroxyacylglutathione hydrolase